MNTNGLNQNFDYSLNSRADNINNNIYNNNPYMEEKKNPFFEYKNLSLQDLQKLNELIKKEEALRISEMKKDKEQEEFLKSLNLKKLKEYGKKLLLEREKNENKKLKQLEDILLNRKNYKPIRKTTNIKKIKEEKKRRLDKIDRALKKVDEDDKNMNEQILDLEDDINLEDNIEDKIINEFLNKKKVKLDKKKQIAFEKENNGVLSFALNPSLAKIKGMLLKAKQLAKNNLGYTLSWEFTFVTNNGEAIEVTRNVRMYKDITYNLSKIKRNDLDYMAHDIQSMTYLRDIYDFSNETEYFESIVPSTYQTVKYYWIPEQKLPNKLGVMRGKDEQPNNLNCALELLSKLTEIDENKIKELNDKYYDTGITITQLAEEFPDLSFKETNLFGDITYEDNKHRIKINIANIKNHAYDDKEIRIIDKTPTEVVWVRDKTELAKKFVDEPLAIGMGTIDFMKNFQTLTGKIYKIISDVFINEDDYLNNKDKINPFTSTIISRCFKSLVEKYKLVPLQSKQLEDNKEIKFKNKENNKKPEDLLYNYVKSSNRFPKPMLRKKYEDQITTKKIEYDEADGIDLDIQIGESDLIINLADIKPDIQKEEPKIVENYTNGLFNHYDQKRAFLQYKNLTYYEKYGFPQVPAHWFKAKKIDSKIVPLSLEYLNASGFSQVFDVEIIHPLLRETKEIENYCVYPNVLLKFILDNKLATFKIKSTAFNADKTFIDFELTQIDGIEIPNQDDNPNSKYYKNHKKLQNAIMGRFIPKDDYFSKTVLCKDENEFLNLKYSLRKKIVKTGLFVANGKTFYYITYNEKSINRNSYEHIHSYIYAYQRISFLPYLLANYDQLIGYYVDAIYLESDIKPIDLEMLKNTFIHPVNLVHSKKIIQHNNCIRSNKPYKEKIPLTEPEFYNNPLYLIKNRVFEIIGAGGTGKTTCLTKRGILHNSIITFPTNDLKNDFEGDIPSSTYHSLFSIGTWDAGTNLENQKYLCYSNIIIDEASMIGMKHMQEIISKIPSYIYIYIIKGIKQLEPVGDIQYKLTNIKDNKDSIYIPNKKITLINIKRTLDENFIKDQYKALNTEDINEKMEIFKDRKITSKDLFKHFNYQGMDIIICSTNKRKDIFNKKILKKIEEEKTQDICIKYKKTTKHYAKNQRDKIKKDELDEKKHELAYASTIHMVQGKTMNCNVFLDSHNLWDDKLFNVGMSRTKKRNQFFIIDDSINKLEKRTEKLEKITKQLNNEINKLKNTSQTPYFKTNLNKIWDMI